MKTARRHARHRPVANQIAAPFRLAPQAPPGCTAAEVFEVLWSTLADVIGPTATAALMQRSVKRASGDAPELRDLVITRDQFAYTYTLPASWSGAAAEPVEALKSVMRQLWPLLSELTGSVVVRRLQEEPLLRHCGVLPEEAGR